MRGFFKNIQKDSVISISFWTTCVLTAITCIGIVATYTNLPPFVPLYNHLPWGYARLGRTYELFIPPFAVCIFTIVNTIIGIHLLDKYPLLARFLFVTMVGLALCVTIFIFRLILLII